MAIYQELMRGAAAGSIGAGAQIVTSRLIDPGGSGAPMLPTATLGVTVGVATGQIHAALQRRGRSSAPPLAILMISLASTTATGLHRLLTGHRLMNDRRCTGVAVPIMRLFWPLGCCDPRLAFDAQS